MWRHLPNLLTLLRIGALPILVWVFFIDSDRAHLYSTIVFFLATITDWFDGYIARKYNLTSNLGAFLDPVADKLIVAVALILVLQNNPEPWLAIAICIIIGREIVVSALREWMATTGQQDAVAVSWLGKLKTMIQMLSIGFLIYSKSIGDFPTETIGYYGIATAAVLTLWSMFVYLKKAWPILVK